MSRIHAGRDHSPTDPTTDGDHDDDHKHEYDHKDRSTMSDTTTRSDDTAEAQTTTTTDDEYSPMIPEAELLDALRRMADDLGRTPTSSEMRANGPYCSSTYFRRFDSWASACKAANLPKPNPSVNRKPSIPLEDLLDDLRMGALALGRPPLTSEVNTFGEYSQPTYRHRFNGWERALYIAGILTSEGKLKYGTDGELILSPPRIPFVGEVPPPISVTAIKTSIEGTEASA